MDKVVDYKKIARQIIEQYAVEEQSSPSEVETAVITDDQHGHYLLLSIGWQDNRRTYFPFLHLDVKDNKIFIEKNLTELSVAKELERMGVAKHDIVLAFQAPYKRKFTEYAVA
jgi:XisI protein